MQTDIARNRSAGKYTTSENIRRLLWGLAKPFFRFSPRIFFGWRNLLLRLFGAKVGSNVHIYNSAVIYFPWNFVIGDWSSIGEGVRVYNLGPIRIGSGVTVSQHAHLCAGTHDFTDPALKLLKPPITIQDQVWICADAYVGPGVEIGEGAVIGARAVAVKDVSAWEIVVGNPACVIKHRDIRRN